MIAGSFRDSEEEANRALSARLERDATRLASSSEPTKWSGNHPEVKLIAYRWTAAFFHAVEVEAVRQYTGEPTMRAVFEDGASERRRLLWIARANAGINDRRSVSGVLQSRDPWWCEFLGT